MWQNFRYAEPDKYRRDNVLILQSSSNLPQDPFTEPHFQIPCSLKPTGSTENAFDFNELDFAEADPNADISGFGDPTDHHTDFPLPGVTNGMDFPPFTGADGTTGYPIHTQGNAVAHQIAPNTNQSYRDAILDSKARNAQPIQSASTFPPGRQPNIFDFMFMDDIHPEESIPMVSNEADTTRLSDFLNSLEASSSEKDDTDHHLQSYLIQQQVMAGITPDSMHTMFHEKGSNATNHPNNELIVTEDEFEISGPDRPQYQGSTKPIPPLLRAAVMTELQITAAEQRQMEREYYDQTRNFLGLAPSPPGNYPKVPQQTFGSFMNPDQTMMEGDGSCDLLESFFGDNGNVCLDDMLCG